MRVTLIVLATCSITTQVLAQKLDYDLDVSIPQRVAEKSAWWHTFPQNDIRHVQINDIQNITARISDPSFSAAVVRPPMTVHREVTKFKNCTSVQQSKTAEYQHQATNTVEVTIQNGFKSSVSIKIGFKAQPGNVGPEFDASYNQEISFMRTDRNLFSSQDSEKRSVPVIVPPWTLLKGDVTETSAKTDIAFAANVVIDADVTFEWWDSDANPIMNHNVLTRKLSWALPDETDRTFLVNGFMRGGIVNESDIEFLSRELKHPDAVDCPAPTNGPTPRPLRNRAPN